eukprot:3457348-Rhodomonas_salina.1
MSTSAGTSIAYILDLRVGYKSFTPSAPNACLVGVVCCESFTPSAPNACLVGVVCSDGCGVLIAILLWYFSSTDRVA